MTEVWFRNPLLYIKECAERLAPNIVWDRGVARKSRIDANRHIEAYYPTAVDYRILMIGRQGAAELRRGHTIQNPIAVYPVWEYGTPISHLRRMLENPVGQDVVACSNLNRPRDERPVFDQEHRVVITKVPILNEAISRPFYRELSDIQLEFPEAIIHLHGSYSFSTMFGLGYAAADCDPREHAYHGEVILGNGRSVPQEQAGKFQQWVHVLGFSLGDLAVPRNRCMFNMASAEWAGKYWNEASKFRSMYRNPAEIQAIADAAFAGKPLPPSQTQSYLAVRAKAQPGDRIVCNACSLAKTCKYYREEGVCAVPGTDSASLASHFKTRDSDKIIEGALTALQMQSDRAERAVADEREDEELNKDTTVLLHTVFDDAVKAAKLVNPALAAASATRVNVGVAINQGQPAPMNVLVANAMEALKGEGYDLDDITDEMITAYLVSNNRKQHAIEVSSG